MSASPRTRRLLIRSPTEGLRLCRIDKAATARWRRGPSEQEGDLKTETGLRIHLLSMSLCCCPQTVLCLAWQWESGRNRMARQIFVLKFW